MDLFRDAVWQFVGAILGLLAIIITIVIFFVQRKRKMLSYEVISQTSVISAADEIAGKIQILFQGDPVSKVHLLVLKLANTGNVPVISGDFEREVSFKFGENTQVLTADVSETIPDNLEAEVSIVAGKSIVVKPILLNGGDAITLKALVSNFDDKISVDGRVVGVKLISNRVESTAWGFVLMVIGTIMSASVIFFNEKVLTSSNPFSEYPVPFVIFILGYAFMLLGMASNRRFRKLLTAPFDVARKILDILQ